MNVKQRTNRMCCNPSSHLLSTQQLTSRNPRPRKSQKCHKTSPSSINRHITSAKASCTHLCTQTIPSLTRSAHVASMLVTKCQLPRQNKNGQSRQRSWDQPSYSSTLQLSTKVAISKTSNPSLWISFQLSCPILASTA